MTQSILDTVSRKVCLVLDKRLGLWEETEKTLPFQVERFIVGDGGFSNLNYSRIDDGEKPPVFQESIQYATWHQRTNAYDAWKSHRAIFLDCIRDWRFQSLLLLEDDAYLTSDFNEVLEDTSSMLSDQWDVLYLGYYPSGLEIDTPHRKVKWMRGGGGFHGVILTKKVILELLKYPPIGPYDWIMRNHHKYSVTGGFICFGITPNIIKQASGFSFVEGHHLEKDSSL